MRIGLSTGDATCDGGDYFGEPVIEAARLCKQADGGQIVTTDVVRMLARRGEHAFRELGTFELKGLPNAVEACELRWEPAKAVAHVPLPARLAVAPGAGLVGRAAEQETPARRVEGGVGRARGNAPFCCRGEPGIGKTTSRATWPTSPTTKGPPCSTDDARKTSASRTSRSSRHSAPTSPPSPRRSLAAVRRAAAERALARIVPIVRARVPGLAGTAAERPGRRALSAVRCRLRGAVPSWPQWRRSCSCSTICTGPTSRRSCCSATSS